MIFFVLRDLAAAASLVVFSVGATQITTLLQMIA